MNIQKAQKIEDGTILINDSLYVPESNGNVDYQQVLQWVTNGGKIIPKKPSEYHVLNENDEWIEDTALRQQVLIRAVEDAVQAMHDAEAQSRGYDNINSIGKYVGCNNVFQEECLMLCQWVAGCWAKCYELLNTGQEITVEEALAQMPSIGTI